MPTIDITRKDLCALVGAELTVDEIDRHLQLVKGELKRRLSNLPEELRVELQDTNRPDTWCVEGVARQIRQWLGKGRSWRKDYGFLEKAPPLAGHIDVDASVMKVRPYVAAFTASGWKVSDDGLKAFIQAQETLSRNYGRKRATVAIGIYDASRIAWPIRYEAVPLEDRKRAFVPLLADKAMTPGEILREHPTGKEFAAALPKGGPAPILVDSKNEVLSFPPIINSSTLGRVVPGMTELFVEVTGTVHDHVLLATNILAANLRDRGATIKAVATRYPEATKRGKEVVSPHALPEKRTLELFLADFRRLLGEPSLAEKDVLASLERYGLEASASSGSFNVEAPPYRMDYLHAVDAVEDFAMARGYEHFQPLMPEEFTVGRLDSKTELADRARDRMIGYGFEEAICNILTEERLLREAMHCETEPSTGTRDTVRIANVMNASYSTLRDWLIPSLLECEARSAGAVYPHRIFEAGEVAISDPQAPLVSRTEQRLGALLAHDQASFSEAQGYLALLVRHLTKNPLTLQPFEHPAFLPGRAARVVIGGKEAGVLGELHPEVLAGARGYGIRVPCAAFEVALDRLG
ncbi:MAG TPA: phenylalanine--tRNA ligase subunit beta [Planctomycetota bacterium]|nr:phenylalanine--tRNA ligase subunit beta [Planctomycetota bacterium]